MRTISIVEATPAHVLALRNMLRAGDAEEIACAGETPARALWRSFRGSIIRRAVFIDGDLGAVWGCGGSALAGIGEPWLLTAPAIERVPVSFVRKGRVEVAKMLGLFPRLENMVLARYGRACRFLGVLGFRLDEPVIAGPRKEQWRRFWMER